MIKCVDEGKAIINATYLGKASVGGGSNYKSPSGDLGVVEEESEKHLHTLAQVYNLCLVLKKQSILLFYSNEQHTDYKSARAWGVKKSSYFWCVKRKGRGNWSIEDT